MINKECFTTEWIAQKSIELKYNDKNLIEKVIRAFSLLEMLAASGEVNPESWTQLKGSNEKRI